MSKNVIVTLAAGVLALSSAGCATKPGPADGPKPAPANVGRVTLHVAGMTKLQGIT